MSSIASIVQGLDYQYRHFWIEAARLLYEGPLVGRVCLEHEGVKAWDDVVTFYNRPIPDYQNRGITADHYQLKYHVDGRSTIRAADLADPGFIGAEKHSLLSRLAETTGTGEEPKRFTLVTSWQVDQADPLFGLLSNGQGQILLNRLFLGGRRSEPGKIRDAWRGHLGLSSEDDLRPILGRLAIMAGIERWRLERDLEARLSRAGLMPVDPGSARHAYADLARAFIDRGDTEFDAAKLRVVCEREGLCAQQSARLPVVTPRALAITSFPRYAAHLEDESDALDLVPLFEGRSLAPGVDWDRDVVPLVDEFLQARVASGGSYALNLDCHASAAYAAGYLLSKSGADLAPVQAGGQVRTVWRPSRAASVEPWDMSEVRLGGGRDVAVALQVSQSIAADVELFCTGYLGDVGRVIVLTVPGGPSRGSARDADHAKALALGALQAIRTLRSTEERRGRLHLFTAAPNGLVFFLGQEGPALGPTTVYEYDFDSMRPGAYSPGVNVPRRAQET